MLKSQYHFSQKKKKKKKKKAYLKCQLFISVIPIVLTSDCTPMNKTVLNIAFKIGSKTLKLYIDCFLLDLN